MVNPKIFSNEKKPNKQTNKKKQQKKTERKGNEKHFVKFLVFYYW